MVLASLGATSTDDDYFTSASDWELSSESSQWWSGADSSGMTLTPPSSEGNCGKKRKIDEVDGQQRSSPRSTLTWPSLVFSRSLNPLEVRLNMSSDGGQVVVARSVADVIEAGENLNEKHGAQDAELPWLTAPVNASDNSQATTDSRSDVLCFTQDQGGSQVSDWHFLDSQTSSLGLEDLPDSQSLSQVVGPYTW